jgi:coenzyme F420-reducing hydrogenase beta subunit/polysaccharide pyruvyl transferase WcaK-like protein
MIKKEFHVVFSTVDYNHCISCGICDAVCPHDAIDMVYTKFKEMQPTINDNCTECTTCVKYCPFTNDKIYDEAKKATSSLDPNAFGLEDSEYFIAYDNREEKRVKSASGGVVTELAINMLSQGTVTAVIHADMQSGSIGDVHYNASISRSVEEIESKRSSFYAPISFEKVLQEFIDKEEKVLFIGVPCIIRAVNEVFKKNKLFTIALSCSHNVNGQIIDFLAESENVSKEDAFKVNLRNKDDLVDANNFKNHFFTNEKTIFKKNRNHTIFTDTWRSYCFSMNICSKCSDFWGYTADVSIKDAWGKWAKDPLGKSIVVMRNDDIKEIFLNDKFINKEDLDFETIANSQKATTHYKQVQINDRLYKPKYHINNLLNGYTLKNFISHKSKEWYIKYGYKKTYNRLKVFILLSKLIDLKGKIVFKLQSTDNPYIKYMKFYIKKVTNLFIYKKEKRNYQILITGGYGNKNVGDEAQLNATLQLLEKELPRYRKVVLTHDRDYTHNEHGKCIVFESPREAFFDHTDIKLYTVANIIAKIQFGLMAIIIYFNAYLVRAGLPTFLINAKKAALLEEIKNSDMLFYSGGGYLTGKTLSRLWDGMLFISIAKVMDVPVVLSGHTIGIWNSKFNKILAKWGLSKAKVITVRDPEESMEALKGIGIENDNTFVTFDDALFCDRADDSIIKQELLKSGLSELDFENYVTLNIHYWGIYKDKKAQKKIRERINTVVNYLIEEQNKKIVLIAMTPSDYNTIDDYSAEYPNQKIIKYKYEFDFRLVRGVIANSKVCITMKHHPIIFAVGEKVPVISLANFNYYVHKNGGALKLFGLLKFNINFDDNFKLNDLKEIYESIDTDITKYKKDIDNKLIQLKINKQIFIDKCKNILKG